MNCLSDIYCQSFLLTHTHCLICSRVIVTFLNHIFTSRLNIIDIERNIFCLMIPTMSVILLVSSKIIFYKYCLIFSRHSEHFLVIIGYDDIILLYAHDTWCCMSSTLMLYNR